MPTRRLPTNQWRLFTKFQGGKRVGFTGHAGHAGIDICIRKMLRNIFRFHVLFLKEKVHKKIDTQEKETYFIIKTMHISPLVQYFYLEVADSMAPVRHFALLPHPTIRYCYKLN